MTAGFSWIAAWRRFSMRLAQNGLRENRAHWRVATAVLRRCAKVGEGGEVCFGAVAFVRGEAVAGVARF